MPDFYDDLTASLARAWHLLEAGAEDRRSGFHTVQLGTVDAAGAPDLRTVVLRGVDRAARRLRFHTDRRAAKVGQIAARPDVMIHGYDPSAKVQLRLSGRASVMTDGPVWRSAWAATGDLSRECYRMLTPSAATLETPGDAVFDAAATGDGAAHFAVVLVTVHRLEWLYLAHRGHRRAVFEGAEGGWSGRWLAP